MYRGSALFHLVATLTPPEKRHFRIFAGRHVIGEENGYIALFDAIDSYKGRDPKHFLADHAEAHFTHNFTYNSHYLYQLILRSLQAFRYEDTPNMQLHSMLDKAELLIDRQLYDLADKLLRKAVKEAEEMEDYILVLQALQARRKLMRKLGAKVIWEDLPQLHARIAQVLHHVSTEAEILRCYDQVFLVTQNKINLSKEGEDEAMSHILAEPILQNAANATTFNGSIAWHFVHAFTHSLRGRADLAEPHYRTLVEIWDARPKQIRANQERYALTLVDWLNCCHQLDKYEHFEPSLAAIRALDGLPPAVSVQINWISTNLEVLYYLNTLRLDTATDVAARWEQVLLQNIDKVNENSILSYSFNIALLYFVKEDFSTSLKWLNRILNHPRTQARSDVQRFARTFYLILQIEKRNLTLLETELANTRRTLKLEGTNPLEKAILTLLSKLIFRPQSEWPAYYRRFRDNLQAITKGGGAFFGLQEMQIWVESRLHGRSIAEQLRRFMQGTT